MLAADLSSRKNELGKEKFHVSVFASFGDEAEKFRSGLGDGRVTRVLNDTETKGRPALVTSKAEECIPQAQLVLMPVPSFAHRNILKDISPFVKDKMVIVAMPGQGGFQWVARSLIAGKDVVIAGLNQLPYQCRTLEYGKRVQLIGYKVSFNIGLFFPPLDLIHAFQRNVSVATCPAGESNRIAKLMSDVIGITTVHPLNSFLQVTLTPSNQGSTISPVATHRFSIHSSPQVIHPSIMHGLFNKWTPGITYAEAPLFYQNTDDETASTMDEISAEMTKIAQSLTKQLKTPISVPTIADMMREMYTDELEDPSSTKTIFRTNRGYRGLTAPMTEKDGSLVPNFGYRYLTEDIPHGLCVVKGIALIAGLETPRIDAIIRWAQNYMGKQYVGSDGSPGPDFQSTAAPQALGFDSLESLLL